MQNDLPGDDTPGAGGAAPTPPTSPTPQPPPRPSPPHSGSIIDRATAILTQPEAEWGRIAGEATTVGRLFTSYVLILALIPLLATVIAMLVGGIPMDAMLRFFLPIGLVYYVIGVAIVFVLGLAIDFLTPSFGASRDSAQAMKLAAYSSTAFWVAGVLLVLLFASPIFYWLWMIGGIGYSGYLLYLGLQRVLRVPEDKAPVFTAAAVGIWVVLLFVGQELAEAISAQLFRMTYLY